MMRMKAIKVSDQLHKELTALVGQLIAESSQIKTYEDAVESLLHRAVVLPPEFLQEVEKFIKGNNQFGYSTREEFLREAARWLINRLQREQIGLTISKLEDIDCFSQTVSQSEA